MLKDNNLLAVNKFSISAVLCAAGLSSRMGKHNKLLLDYKGVPIIYQVTQELLHSNIDELILVTGHESHLIMDALSTFRSDITFVNNPSYPSGHTSTIQTGIRSIKQKSRGIMICLGDLPLITTQGYNDLINHFYATYQGDALITRPEVDKKPGHPVIFSHDLTAQILQLKTAEGGRNVIQTNQSSLRVFSTDNEAYIADIDTMAEYRSLNATI